MNRVDELLYNDTAETLIWDAPEGRPASVTSVQIWDIGTGDDGTEETAPGTGTVETNPNTYVGSASGYSQSDRTLITVNSGTGISVGRTYLLTNTLGEKEWVTVKAVTGTSVYAASPLKNDYAASASSTFVSTRITSLINSTWIADDNQISDALSLSPGYRVQWTYVVGTTTYVHDSYFDVVRYKWTHSVTEADMRSYVSDWDERLPTHHREDGGARLIEQASNLVKWDLRRAGIDPALVRHNEIRDELVMAKSHLRLESPGTEAHALAVADYNTLLDGILRVTRKVPIAVDNSGAGYKTVAKGIWSK